MRLWLALIVCVACGGGDRASAPTVTAPPPVVHDAAVVEPPPVPSYEVARSSDGFRAVATSATHVAWSTHDTVWRRPHGVDGAVERLGVIEGVGGVYALHVGASFVYAYTIDARVVALRAGAEPAVLPVIAANVVAIDGDDVILDDRGRFERYRGDQHVDTLTAWPAPHRPSLDGFEHFEHHGAVFDADGGVVIIGQWRFQLDDTAKPVRASFDAVGPPRIVTHPLALTATHVYISAPLPGDPATDVLRAVPRRGAYPVIALDRGLGHYEDIFSDGTRVYAIFESDRVGPVEDTAYRIDTKGAHAVHTASRLAADADGDDFAFDEDGDPVAAHAGRKWWPSVRALASRPIHGGDTIEIAVPDGERSFHGNLSHSWIAFDGDRAFVVGDETIIAFDLTAASSRVVWRHPQMAEHAHGFLTGDIVAIAGALYIADRRDVTRVSPDGKTSTIFEGDDAAQLTRLDATAGRLFALDHGPTPSQIVEIPLDGGARRPVLPMPGSYQHGRYALTNTDIHLYVPGIHAIAVVPLP